MGAKKDYTGCKNGRLTLIKYIDNIGSQRAGLFQCDCGNQIIHRTGDVFGNIGRHRQSCGCISKAGKPGFSSKAPGVASFNRLYTSYQKHAVERNLEFALTKEQFHIICQQNCFYCGIEPAQSFPGGWTKKDGSRDYYVYNGIDRLNNDNGYHMHNVVAACVICNYAKGKKTIDEFATWINRIGDYKIELGHQYLKLPLVLKTPINPIPVDNGRGNGLSWQEHVKAGLTILEKSTIL